VVIQARATSTRLPGKVLLPLAGAPAIRRVVERVTKIEGIDAVVVAIPHGRVHEPIAEAVSPTGVAVFSGSEDDVLARTLGAAESLEASVVIRITSDCPLFDPKVSGAVLSAFRTLGVTYARTAMTCGYPVGFETEVISIDSLRTAATESVDPYEREHVTPFIWRHPDRFAAVHISCEPDRRAWRLTIDTREDFELASQVYDELFAVNPAFGLRDLTDLFCRRPDLLQLNAGVAQKPIIGRPGPIV